jgi:tRNA A-37 threonylcarbamoyl transferase component Bud32/predicted hydrocarbon binding protein
VHGLIFFYIQKFAATLATTSSAVAARPGLRAALQAEVIEGSASYLPAGTYPDEKAVALLGAIADTLGEPLEAVLGRFGEFLAAHLIRVAGPLVDSAWRTLDLLEHTEQLIHGVIRTTRPGAEPPVLEAVRVGPAELHLVYTSRRRLCVLAAGVLRGVARHYGETVVIEEPGCMLRGDPFCSFVVRLGGRDTHAAGTVASDTVVVAPGVASVAVDPIVTDPGLADEPAAEPLPARIGPYPVLGLIGSGAMGRVYLARDESLDRSVAIKVMRSSRARDPGARQRFLREGRAAAAISHPHVLTVHGVGEHEQRPYIVMQYLEGLPLSALLLPLPVPVVLRIGREIASGLAAAHERGLVHRDIKPDNVFLEGPARSVRIIDFGLARGIEDDSATVTVEGAVVGTPAYMPPERIDDDALDARSDLFGLGVMLYELLAGRLPYRGDSMVAMLAAIARGNPVPLAEVAEVPAEVADLVMRLMAHRREDRPADARTVAAEMAALERRFSGV